MVVSDHLSSANVELDCEKGTLAIREEFRPYGETSYSSYELKRYRFTRKVPIATGAAKLQQLEKTGKSDDFIINAFTDQNGWEISVGYLCYFCVELCTNGSA